MYSFSLTTLRFLAWQILQQIPQYSKKTSIIYNIGLKNGFSNFIQINAKFYGNRNNTATHQYNLDNTILEDSTCEKDLGVLIDNRLTFNNHIDEKVKKANRVMGVIRRSF